MHKPFRFRSHFFVDFLLLLTLLLLCISARAQQPGELDTGFMVEDVGMQIGGFKPNLSAVVLTTALQEDNKIIIGGRFINYDGQDRNGIARLNTDGSLDPGFDPGTGFDGGVEALAIQPDGKIIVGGNFSNFNGISRKSIARLNADGSLDTSFDPGTGFNHQVHAVVIQPDGKIVAGGEFTIYNGTASNYIIRLNADGTPDAGFNTGAGFNGGTVKDIAIQSDGKIVIGGSFRRYDGIERSGIARLNTDGSLDTSFDPGYGVDGQIEALALQADGKIVAGGVFFNFNSTLCKSIVRINADGSRDTSFVIGLNFRDFDTPKFFAIAVQPDGKIIVGGDFYTFHNGGSANTIMYMARLQEDGSIDPGFDYNTRFNNVVGTFSLQTDGRIVVGGSFNHFGPTRDYICRLNNQGSVDPGFNYVSGFDNFVNVTAVQEDGKIIVGGNFLSFSDKNRSRIARLHPDGTLDTSFDIGTGFNSGVMALAVQGDGKIIVGGVFDNFNGTNRQGIVRLNADGSLDPSFISEEALNGYPRGLILLPDGKIIVNSTLFNTLGEKHSIVRLNNDGSLDTGFNPDTDFSNGIETAAVQADGKVLVGGNIPDYKGLGLNHIVRLNADGSLDTGFNPGTGFDRPVSSLVIQEDGKIVVVGSFEKFNGKDRKGIARLNTNGSLDTGFDPGAGFVGGSSRIALQSGGKLLLTGDFSSYDGTDRNRIARINHDGSLNKSFDPGTGFNARIYSISVQPDENILIGGLFTSYNGNARNHMVRIYGGDKAVTGLPFATFGKGVTVYPNPFTSEISVKLPQTPVGQVQVLVKDLTGRTVYGAMVTGTTGQAFPVKLDDSLPKGVYLLQVRYGQETGSYQVIKQ